MHKKEYHNLYGRKWQRLRLTFLKHNPLCVYCDKRNRVKAAEVVDHIIPHKGCVNLFWDQTNWQGLCKQCHDSTKQQEEKSGYHNEIGTDGWPVDRKHPIFRNGAGSGN